MFKHDYLQRHGGLRDVKNELTVLMTCNHPNINKMIGYGSRGKLLEVDGQEEQNLVHLILEYIPGGQFC